MKKIILFTVLCLFSYNFSIAQTEEEIIKNIRERFTTITSFLESYETIEKDIEGESTEGGYMKAYHVDGEIVMLHCAFYGESGNLKEDYYYDNGKLFFVYTIAEKYNLPAYMEDAKVETVEENRYYINDDKLIRWLVDINKKRTTKDKKSKVFFDKENEIILEAQRMLEIFNNN
jgi:hypothetical protein